MADFSLLSAVSLAPALTINERKSHVRREYTVFRKGNELLTKLPRHDVRVAIFVQTNGNLSAYTSHPDEEEFWHLSHHQLRDSEDVKLHTPFTFMSAEALVRNNMHMSVGNEAADEQPTYMSTSEDGVSDEEDVRPSRRTLSINESPRPAPRLIRTPRTTRPSTPVARLSRSTSTASRMRWPLERPLRPEVSPSPQIRHGDQDDQVLISSQFSSANNMDDETSPYEETQAPSLPAGMVQSLRAKLDVMTGKSGKRPRLE